MKQTQKYLKKMGTKYQEYMPTSGDGGMMQEIKPKKEIQGFDGQSANRDSSR